MAGHNKWSKVKHIKAVVDAKKGKVFSKISRELTMAAKHGGRDPDLNPRLRSAIGAAKAANMPSDNVDRAIKKGAGELEGAMMEELTYEGYGPGGVALMIESVTDNKNRSYNDLRTTFGKGGGSIGSQGSVAHLFQRIGEVRVAHGGLSEEAMTDTALEAGADDVVVEDEEYALITSPEKLYVVATFLKLRGIDGGQARLTYQPHNTITLTDVDTARQVLKLYDALDDLDDTQNVHVNFEIAEDVLQALEA